ncbi:MAG TPA: thiamine pyrophosphate-dependent enzyme, partial [Anaerovoracaceae bacterium]|nr:thiamine pyrophosphate-dependent enzyme [Anaerovoracaceae bacterium]
FQMQMMELATICQNDIDINIVVMKNNKLGLVKEIQKKSYKNNEVAVDLTGSPDVVAIARAYGIPGQSIDNMDAAEGAIAEMLGCKGTYLLECIVDENESSM